MRTSLLARKLTSLHAVITTKTDFAPEVYQHNAGLVFYYDNMNYVWLRKYWSETLNAPALSVMEVDRGVKHVRCEKFSSLRRTAACAAVLLFMFLCFFGFRYNSPAPFPTAAFYCFRHGPAVCRPDHSLSLCGSS